MERRGSDLIDRSLGGCLLEGDLKMSALGRGLEKDLPIHASDQALGNGKSEAGALTDVTSGEEGIKDPGRDFRGDPGSTIAEVELDRIGLKDELKGNGAFSFDGMEGVEEKIDENLTEFAGMSEDFREGIGGIKEDLHVSSGRCGSDQVEGFVEDGAEIDGTGLGGGLLAAVVEKLADDLADPFELGEAALCEVVGVLLLEAAVTEQFCVSHHGSKGIADLVGDAGSELADGGELLGADQ